MEKILEYFAFFRKEILVIICRLSYSLLFIKKLYELFKP